MKAIILVGGFGTRLRPLTLSVPKPLVPFCNKEIVLHQIEALVRVGVKEVILAVNYKPEAMTRFLVEAEKRLKVKITISLEDEPMGTAGPLAIAKDLLMADGAEPFFMFNSDVICEFPLEAMLAYHKRHGNEGTIMVTPVEDPSKYGVVVFDEDESSGTGPIQRFVEKPKKFVGNSINAGLYLFNTSVIKRVPMKPTSIEREIFPAMASDEELHAMRLPGYWMDVGQPKDYLTGTCLHLASLAKRAPADLAEQFEGNVLMDETATVGDNCRIGPDVVIGPGAVIGNGVRLQRTVVLAGAKIGDGASINNTIVGWETRIGRWAHVTNSVIGMDVNVPENRVAYGATVCPHKGLKEDILSPTIIL